MNYAKQIVSLEHRVLQYIISSLPLLIIILFSFYDYFNGANLGQCGDVFLSIALLVLIPRFLSKRSFSFSKISVLLFWSFFGLTLASVLFPPSAYANAEWLRQAFYRLFVSLGIVATVSSIDSTEKKILRWGLCVFCLSFFTFATLNLYGIINKTDFSYLSPLPIVVNGWNNKYYAFWLVFLMWGAIALLWRHGRLGTILSCSILVLGSWPVFLTSSESAQLAIVVGCLVFLFCLLPLGKWRYSLYMAMFFCVFLLPFMWVMLTPVAPYLKNSPLSATTKHIYGYYVGGFTGRFSLYDIVTHLIRQNIFLGYGFGSALSLPVPPNSCPGYSTLPGGHPHNIVFLFFLEQGFLGVLWLIAAVYTLFNYLYKNTLNRKQSPAIWALVVSGQVVFSFSFDIWQGDVVLLYTMFFVLLLVAIGNSKDRILSSIYIENILSHFLVILTMTGISCYFVNYFFLL